MYLKYVSLYGFKTFALKTEFVFKPGITAILGPNGCGKSNLFDALVWVLGEQSVRSIRGHKMEDIIFHGSEVRKPLGFAQIELTFDNEDGFFPLPHSEISIVRRHFKSGDSEFEINGEMCRLKDIQNLMLDTGLGKLNYSIINQGDIEYIIGLSPTERRSIFDEAAGINKYKAEKKKTLQKVKDTDGNLARLRDLLTEIEERLGPLDQQSRTARKYEELTERIEGLKLRVMVADIRRIMGVMADADALDVAAAVEMRNIEASTRNAREKLEQRRAGLASAHTEVSAAGQTLGQMTGSLEHHEKALQFVRDSIRQSHQAQARVIGEIGGIDERLKELDAELKELEQKRKDYLAESESLKTQLNGALPAETADFKDELEHEKQLRDKIAASRIELDTLREKYENLRSECKETTARLSSLKDNASEKNRETANAKRQIEQITERLKKRQSEFDEAQKQHDLSQARLKTLHEQARDASQQHGTARKELEQAREHLTYQKARAEHLSAFSRAASGKTPPPDKWIALKKNHVPAPLQLKITQGYEPAVRRALGSLLDAWIIKDADAIQQITPRQAGEMLFFLSNFVSDVSPDVAFKQLPGADGLLCDFATAEGPFAGAVKNLLSRFVVVGDAAKLAELSQGLKNGMALVTKAGDASLENGVLRLGEGLGGREDMKALYTEVQAAVQQGQSNVSALEKKFSEASKRHNDLTKEIDNTENSARKLSYRTVELTSAIKSIENEKSFHEKNIESHASASDKLTENLSALEKTYNEKSGSLKTFEQQLSTLRNEHEKNERLLHGLLENRRASQALLQDLRIRINNRQKEIEAIEENRQYRQRDIERAQSRRAELEGEKRRVEKELEDRNAEFEEIKLRGADLAEKVVAARHTLAVKQTAIKNIEDSIRKDEENIANYEKSAVELREKTLQIQLKRARADAQLEEARRVFSEEFPGVEEKKALTETGPTAPGEKTEYKQLKDQREALGPVNMLAIGEYEDEKSRYDILYAQIEDLEETRATLMDMVNKFDDLSRDQFLEIFARINEKFKETFVEVFEGGTCEISLTDATNPLECGVEIAVQIPGKRMRNISLLSGGEKALCALTLIFAILKVKPSPFYLLDEVDAGLDEGNVGKFKRMMKKYSNEVQFFIITHNKSTLVVADHFYGITMQEGEGFTRVLSVSLENLDAGKT